MTTPMKSIADYLADSEFSHEVFESLQLGMLVVQADWTVVAWSGVLEDWTGTPAEDVLATKLIDRHPHIQSSPISDQLDSVLRTGKPTTLSPPLVSHLLPVSARGEYANLPMVQEVSIHRISCEPSQALIILRDITTEQIQRDELQRERDQRISLEQTLHDTSHGIPQAEASADGNDENTAHFLANMSHEIRSLMTPILGYADLLSSDLTPAIVPTAVDAIRRNGEHLLGLLDDVLDLSRLNGGEVSLNLESVDPCRIATDVVTMLKGRAKAKGLSITTQCDGPLPLTIQTDPVRVRQVLLDLISNAVKFTDFGGITIRIQLNDQDPCCPRIAFDVVDTGDGLALDEVEHLFQAFAHAPDTSGNKNSDHGAGLGLTIGRKLAHILGGDVNVNSSGPTGTTFRFTVATGSLEGVPLVIHDDANELSETRNPSPPRLNDSAPGDVAASIDAPNLSPASR